MPKVSRALTIGLGVCALTVIFAVSASARIKITKCNPEPDSTVNTQPHSIEIRFDQEVDPAKSSIKVTGAKGAVKLSEVHPMGPKWIMSSVVEQMPDGKYTVAWSTGADKGTFTFTIKGVH
jgi:methionine-rich copper-binding protein CopC